MPTWPPVGGVPFLFWVRYAYAASGWHKDLKLNIVQLSRMKLGKNGLAVQPKSVPEWRQDSERIRIAQRSEKLNALRRDLKPENVLLSIDGEVKLSDFGLGALPESTLVDGMLRTTCGTPNYVAPEVLARKGYAGGPADIWSLGVLPTLPKIAKLPKPNCQNLQFWRARAMQAAPLISGSWV